jgi:TP901-1 family phage major tail protein
MGYVKGDSIRFYNQGVVLGLEMEVSLTASLDTIETTDKDSAGWKTFIDGDKSWTCSGTANLDWAATENISDIFADFIAGTAVAIDIGSATDSKYYGGNGIINSWSFEGPRNGLATFSFEVQGTGALTEGATT